ncbi:hypothetical protein Cni_G11191 [Canna indica]|uniref:Uncharacterized protein n=1 Tax=Canna indica TaxID=4628 RepID=A0AAQ3K5W5_9LILI|nr:hypothetical protein Cni_G11191 [Canna indica]
MAQSVKVVLMVAVLLALCAGNAMGIRIEKSRRHEVFVAAAAAKGHGEAEELLPVKRLVPTGPNVADHLAPPVHATTVGGGHQLGSTTAAGQSLYKSLPAPPAGRRG